MNTPSEAVLQWCIQNSPSSFFSSRDIEAFFREFTCGSSDVREYRDCDNQRVAVFCILSKLTNAVGYIPAELLGHQAGSDLSAALVTFATELKSKLPSEAQGFTIKLQEKFRDTAQKLRPLGYELLNETYLMVAEPMARPSDAPKFKVEKIQPPQYRELYTLMQNAFVGDFNIVFPEYESWLRRRSALHMTSWVVRDGDRLVGFSNLVIKDDVTLEVRTLGTDPEYQRRGIGAALLNHAMNFAADQNCASAVLGVTTTKRHALKLYESFGFRAVDSLMTWGWTRH